MPPPMKKMALPGLPDFILDCEAAITRSPSLSAAIFAGVCAFIFGKILMRLSGIAASIATFAMLGRDQPGLFQLGECDWRHQFGGRHSDRADHLALFHLRGHRGRRSPISIRFRARGWRCARRATRRRRRAPPGSTSPANGLSPSRLSGAMMGLGGALYAHSVGVVTPDTFYLELDLRLALDAGRRRHEQPVGRRHRRRRALDADPDPALAREGRDGRRDDAIASRTAFRRSPSAS